MARTQSIHVAMSLDIWGCWPSRPSQILTRLPINKQIRFASSTLWLVSLILVLNSGPKREWSLWCDINWRRISAWWDVAMGPCTNSTICSLQWDSVEQEPVVDIRLEKITKTMGNDTFTYICLLVWMIRVVVCHLCPDEGCWPYFCVVGQFWSTSFHGLDVRPAGN